MLTGSTLVLGTKNCYHRKEMESFYLVYQLKKRKMLREVRDQISTDLHLKTKVYLTISNYSFIKDKNA